MAQNIFITGGGSGIGLAMVQHYKKLGATVGFCDINTEVFSDFANDPDVICYQADVTDKKNLHHAISEFSRIYGLDIIVANAAINIPYTDPTSDFELHRKIIDVNLFGVLNTFEKAIEIMTAKGKGQIVAISSLAAQYGFPGVGAYGPSKAAVQKICENYSLSLKPLGISVTCIAPGFVDTALTKRKDRPMPFILSANQAAIHTANAIAKKKIFYVYPWFFGKLILLLSILPHTVCIKILNIHKFDFRQWWRSQEIRIK